MGNDQKALPGFEIKKTKLQKGRLSKAVDVVIRDSRKSGGPYIIDELTAAMLRTCATNVEAAIAEGSSWAVANAMKELRALRDEIVQPVPNSEGDAFDKLLQDLAADVPQTGAGAP
jgi:hypothetical protein